MAIQFPNFLSADYIKPDYSGISDAVQNYYSGKALPRDALIKQIQAEFARPNAEETLQGLKLGNQGTGLTNQKSMLEIQKLRREMAIQQELERQIAQAMRGGNAGVGTAGIAGTQQPAPEINPALVNAVKNQIAPNAPSNYLNAPIAPASSQMPQSTETQQQPVQAPVASATPTPSAMNVITEGTPRLAGIDALWEQNPLSREFLKKKGFDKKTEIKFDTKTGQTRVLTTYPSGKVTMEVIGSGKSAEGIPLTNKMISQHQRVISSVENVIPVLKRLRDLPKHSNIYTSNLIATHGQKQYERLVNAAKENLIGAFALNPTEAGLQTAIDQLTIGGFETEKEYQQAINDLIKDLEQKKSYSEKEVNKPINARSAYGNEGAEDLSSMSDSELRSIANG